MNVNRTITQIIEEVCNDMCKNYCKYVDQFNEEKEGVELCDSEYCRNCPLNKLQ